MSALPSPPPAVPAAPIRRRAARVTPARLGLYAFLAVAALFFLLPLYVMVGTSLKDMQQFREGTIFAWPAAPTLAAWRAAWSEACAGVECGGVQRGFWNSVAIVVPATLLPVALGALNGYALSLWRPRGGGVLFAALMLGAFVPAQVMLYPLVKLTAALGLFASLPGVVLVHTLFAMPVMTLLFRNHFALLPAELFKAARVDGAGFWRIFTALALPMSLPMVAVAAILQVTGVWNDYLLGLVFAGNEYVPMTVQLNNLVNTTTGERQYNLNMAATVLTALVPLAVYFLCGRWFVRGIAAGAVKG